MGSEQQNLSFVHGPKEPALLDYSLHELLSEQAARYPERDAVICSWTSTRYTYQQLNERCKNVARSLVALGIRRGDRIGILSGNCERYIELFFATTLIGGIVVVLNNTYTPAECVNALEHSGKLFYTVHFM